MCVCTWLEQSRAPTGVPLLHLLCEYSLGGGGKVWSDLADQCWKSCPHTVLVMHTQLILTGLEDARIPGCSLPCSTEKHGYSCAGWGIFRSPVQLSDAQLSWHCYFYPFSPRRLVSTPNHPPSTQPAGNTQPGLCNYHTTKQESPTNPITLTAEWLSVSDHRAGRHVHLHFYFCP